MRGLVFANDQIYHIYNRGVEKRSTFTDKREYQRGLLTMDYYRYKEAKLNLAKALVLPLEIRNIYFEKLSNKGTKLVECICYCLMPNHYHLLLQQKIDGGITRFMKRFGDSYTRYFNIKNDRVGPLFQGVFKAVRIEDDEELLHVSRYIHLNPVTSYLISENALDEYPWSSLSEYLVKSKHMLSKSNLVLGQFPSKDKYRRFVHDQIDYARKLEKIKHLMTD